MYRLDIDHKSRVPVQHGVRVEVGVGVGKGEPPTVSNCISLHYAGECVTLDINLL